MKVLPIIVVLILAGCIKQTNLPEDIAAIKQLAEDWRGGWLAGDAERLLSLLSDEPVLIMSSEDPIIGKEAIRTLYQYVFENYTFTSDENYTRTSEVEQMEVEVDGDLGYIWSRYTNTETPKAGLIATRSQPTTNSQ
ncbi:MAG: YybH family protein [Planctomycetota bacterium]|jgi:uncharacterized protein (TIGR02246 family)